MNFLVDNQLPPALARFIECDLKEGAMHVRDVNLRGASDEEIWTYASANSLVVISKDEDLANMLLQRPTARLIWIRIGNCRRARLLYLFSDLWPRIIERLQDGDRLIEIR